MKFQIPAKLAKPALKLQKHSPKLMLGVGIVGVVTAGVMACKSTLKLSEALDPTEKLLQAAHEKAEREESYAQGEYQKDVIKLQIHTVLKIAKLYLPAVAVATVSISLITAAHVVQNRRAAAMTAAYAGLKEGYDRLRQQIIDKYGAEEEQKLRQGVRIVEETIEGKDGKAKVVKHERAAGFSPYAALFAEESSANWYPNEDNNIFFLNAQRSWLNDRLNSRGFLFLNEVKEALGLPIDAKGQQVGWIAGTKYGDGYVDFGINGVDDGRIADFLRGDQGGIWLDFNVDGVILDLIP